MEKFTRLFDDEAVEEDVKELELDRNDFNESIPSTRVVVFDKKDE